MNDELLFRSRLKTEEGGGGGGGGGVVVPISGMDAALCVTDGCWMT